MLHIVTKLHDLFAKLHAENSMDYKLTIKIAKIFYRWHSCEGLHGLQRSKTMSNAFVRHLMGTPLRDIPLSNQYKRLLRKALLNCTDTTSKVYWVSVFSMFRLFRTEPLVDTSTITGGFEGRLTGLMKIKYFKAVSQVNKSFRKDIESFQNWKPKFKWHISGAGGPNGTLSYTRYLEDLRSLSGSSLSIGLIILFLSLPYVNRWDAASALRDAILDSLENSEGKLHSRLAFISDKGGKTRVIALGDILSQSLLKTVHQRCNRILRRLIQDGTFDQDRSRRYIKKMSLENFQLASIDLTAATDRMPALYQVFVLISLRILTPIQAFGWWWVTTRRDFVYDKSLRRIRYAVGQPMGLLSSWPVMAISHHYLVRLSFAVTGVSNLSKAPYSVLGDDLCIRGHDVAGEYLKLIDCLGMKFSEEKTYITTGAAEFAKSLYRGGEDLSPFPLALLVFNKNTIVSNTFAIITECHRIKLPLTASVLTGLFPKRWRNLVLLASLSPLRPRSGLDLQARSDQWFFLQFLNSQRIKYFSRLNTVRKSTHAFAIHDPGKSGKELASPFLQIARDNSDSYPVRRLGGDDFTPEVLLGSGWIAYSSKAWPDGIPSLGDQRLIPGPTWEKEKDDFIFRSSLLSFNRLMPGYFTVRCVGKQVGQ